MIRSFAGKGTVLIWEGRITKRIDPTIQRAALRKLGILHAAKDLNDLKIPPGNRLEALIGDKAGQYSIRVNSQWRICFTWSEGGADNVELVDYH